MFDRGEEGTSERPGWPSGTTRTWWWNETPGCRPPSCGGGTWSGYGTEDVRLRRLVDGLFLLALHPSLRSLLLLHEGWGTLAGGPGPPGGPARDAGGGPHRP